jgi:hypothetical protein
VKRIRIINPAKLGDRIPPVKYAEIDNARNKLNTRTWFAIRRRSCLVSQGRANRSKKDA